MKEEVLNLLLILPPHSESFTKCPFFAMCIRNFFSYSSLLKCILQATSRGCRWECSRTELMKVCETWPEHSSKLVFSIDHLLTLLLYRLCSAYCHMCCIIHLSLDYQPLCCSHHGQLWLPYKGLVHTGSPSPGWIQKNLGRIWSRSQVRTYQLLSL